jgi:RNA polymerase sigma factor (sigma-70 family)
MADRMLTDAERDVVEANRGLVYDVAIMMARGGDADEDDVQAGMLGLIRAVQDFDPSLGYTLGTYSRDWIINKIRRHRHDDRLIHTPRYLDGRDDHKCQGYVERAVRAGRFSGPEEGVPDEPWTLDAEPDDGIDAALRDAVAGLPERERRVVERRVAGETLKAIGESMGLTRERIRQIEREAHARLRDKLAPYA